MVDGFRSVRGDFIRLFAARGGAAIGTALGIRAITEIVSPETFGQFRLAAGVALLGTLALAAPYNRYSMRAFHDLPEAGQAAFVGLARRSVTVWMLPWAIVALVASIAASVALSDPLFAALGVGAALLFVAEGRYGHEYLMLITTERLGTTALADIARGALLPLAAVVAAAVVGGAASMLFAQALILLAIAAVALRFLPSGAGVGSVLGFLRKGWSFAFPLMGVGILGWLFGQIDRYVLAIVDSAAEAGKYIAAYSIAVGAIALVGGLVPTVRYAQVVRSVGLSFETSGPSSVERRTIVAQAVLITVLVLALLAFAPLLSSLLLADEYRSDAVPIIRWVAVGHGFQAFANVLDIGSYARNRTGLIALAFFAAFMVNICLNLVWIPRNGALGAAWATAAGGFTYALVLGALLAALVRRQTI